MTFFLVYVTDFSGFGVASWSPKSFFFNNDDDDDGDDDGVMGDWGLKGLKPKAKFLMLLYSEHDLQGLGCPVGAPKPSCSKIMMMMVM